MFQTKIVGKLKTFYVLYPKNSTVYDNVEKCGRPRQATDGNVIWVMLFACWIAKAHIHTLRICNIIHGNSGYVKAPHPYVYTYVASLVKMLNIPESVTYMEAQGFIYSGRYRTVVLMFLNDTSRHL